MPHPALNDTLRMDPADERHPGGYRVLERRVPPNADAPDPISQEVARAIRARGLTQAAVAEWMGTTQSVVARLTSPAYHGHSADSLRRLAEALGGRLEVRLEVASGPRRGASGLT